MFSELMRAHRQQRAMTQEALADKAGISARHIRDLEAGRITRPRPSTVRLVADALELDDGDRQRFHRAALPGAATSDGLGEARQPPTHFGPAQLPMDVYGFAGRDDQHARLDAVLDAADEQLTAVVVSALSGTAGVGKTALAIHWAHRVRDRFPDGQLYVNLRGFDPGGSVMPPAEAVRGFLDALGVSPERIPAGLDARSTLYRSLLVGRRMLVVLDNARDAMQVRPLLPGSPGCLVVITSRDQLTSLIAAVGAQPLILDLLAPAEARRLLAGRLGTDRVAAEPAAVSRIIDYCARLPLALTLVAARAASHPGFSLTALADELRTSHGSLDRFTDPDPSADVRAVFSWSYRTLSAAAARLFRLLSGHPGPHIAIPAAASLAGVSPDEARKALEELARAHLVTEPAPGRYAFHDLLRAYAAELARTDDHERGAAGRRVLDHYLRTAHAAGLRLHPHRDRIQLVPAEPGVTAQEVPDHQHALRWFTAEHPALLAAVREAADSGLDAQAWQLAWAVATFLDRRGHWHDLAAIQTTALAAARRLADRPGEVQANRLLGLAYARLGQYADARIHIQTALDLSAALGDDAGQGHSHMNLAQVFARQDRHAEALSHAQQAHAHFKAAGHRYGQANALNAIGWYHAQLDDYRATLASCARALPLQREIGDRHGQAATWDSIGYAHHHLGNSDQAVACYQRAMVLYREVGDRFHEADTLIHLGDTHHAAGNLDDAHTAWRRALAILDDLGHPTAAAVRARLQPDGSAYLPM